MNVPNVLNEDIDQQSETDWEFSIDIEPSNIISLSKQGLLLTPVSKFTEDFVYHQYSPLNEW
jgi:hypothetical protein